jgi:hypothetical protein
VVAAVSLAAGSAWIGTAGVGPGAREQLWRETGL